VVPTYPLLTRDSDSFSGASLPLNLVAVEVGRALPPDEHGVADTSNVTVKLARCPRVRAANAAPACASFSSAPRTGSVLNLCAGRREFDELHQLPCLGNRRTTPGATEGSGRTWESVSNNLLGRATDFTLRSRVYRIRFLIAEGETFGL
jgi:hypothetical protein